MNGSVMEGFCKVTLIGFFCLFAFAKAEVSFAENLKLGVVYSLIEEESTCKQADHCNLKEHCEEGEYDEDKSDCKEGGYVIVGEQVKKDLDEIRASVASDKPERKHGENTLNLVIQTEVPWKYSNPPKKNSVENFFNFEYLKAYARELNARGIKWTPLLGVAQTPQWLENVTWTEEALNKIGNSGIDKDILDKLENLNTQEYTKKGFEEALEAIGMTKEQIEDYKPMILKYADTLQNDIINGHDLPFKPDSEAWNKAKPWVMKFVETLSEPDEFVASLPNKESTPGVKYVDAPNGYIGEGRTIEEILIANEMGFSKEGYKEEDPENLKILLIKLRSFVLEALGEKDVPVSWKYNPYAFANSKNDPKCYGLTKEMLKGLFEETQLEFIGLDVYEGVSSECKDTGQAVDVYKIENQDIEVGIGAITDEYGNKVFKGKMYFTEYNAQGGGFSSEDLRKCIIGSWKNGVPYWTYYKWNGPKNDPSQDGHIQPPQIEGLHAAFEELDNNLGANECQNFPDVKRDVWFCKFVEKLHQEGVVSGDFPEGTYRPGDPMNRAEFLKVLLEAAYGDEIFKWKSESGTIDKPSERPFPDVSITEWFAPYVEFAKQKGIIKGDDSDELYHPSRNVNRAEAAKMLVKTGRDGSAKGRFKEIHDQYEKLEKGTDIVSEDDKFSDENEMIGKWFYFYVYACKKQGIVHGFPNPKGDDYAGKFAPVEGINRAMVAKIICLARYGDECNKDNNCCEAK